MKTFTKLALSALAVSLLGTAAVKADSVVTRLDHPNGQPTFIYTPESNGQVPTIGVYENGRSFGTAQTTDAGVTRIDHPNGVPNFVYTPRTNVTGDAR